MTKAIISNRIFIETDLELEKNLFDNLTYKIPAYRSDLPPTIITTARLIKPGLLSIPSGRTDLIPEYYDIIDKRVEVPVEFPPFKFDLRPSQQAIYEEINSNAFINAWTSFGKTFTALAIAGKLSQKTLIVVHTLALRDQWAKEVEKVYGISPSIIGSGKSNFDGPIVIGNIQTLTKMPREVLNKSFGAIITDECLDYEQLVTLSDGTRRKIGAIVNNKESVTLLSYNLEKRIIEPKKVVNWYKNPIDDWMIKFKFSDGSSLKCTLNHSLYDINFNKKPAEDFYENDYLVSPLVNHKSANLLKQDYINVLLGLLLGDGNLCKTSSNVRLRITNGQAQKEYLEWKANIFSDLFNKNEINGESGYKPENKIFSYNSYTFIDTLNLYDNIYTSGKKTKIPKNLVEKLDSISWALIYQDDGSINKKTITFSMCEFDKGTLNNLIESLSNQFGVKAEIYTCNKGYNYIKLNTKNSEKFLEHISEFIHPSMEYKFGEYKRSKPFKNLNLGNTFESYTIKKITNISFEKALNGYRYNIEVEDNHNYVANNTLVANCHHIPSKTFSTLIDANHAKFKIGLSASSKRKDGLHVLFSDYFSKKTFTPPRENYVTPTIHRVSVPIRVADGAQSWAEKVNDLCISEDYQRYISLIAASYAAKGHKVLVVASRTKLLEACSELTPNSVCVIGATKDRDTLINKVKHGQADVLYGSTNIFSEGISVNELSCLILATPINNAPLLEQLIGRVIRKHPNKPSPIIVDILLTGKTVAKQAQERKYYYQQQGYTIKDI
jgi:superfamily II DNA or RNA helicase/intein/homing endonuclease